VAVLPGYTPDDAKARACAYIETGGLPLTGTCPNPGNATIDVVTGVSIPAGGGAALEGTSVTVTFNHTYMFVGPIAGLFSGTFTTSFPISSTAVMRNELPSAP
jgi:hypothetical protein